MAPSVRDTAQTASWVSTVTPRDTSTTLDWEAGDKILVIGSVGDETSTLAVPTATGLTFTQLVASGNGSGDFTDVWVWSADAAAPGSSLINGVRSGGGSSWGMIAFAVGGHNGIGDTEVLVSTAQVTPFTRTATGSLIISVGSDWQGNVAGAGTNVPTGATEHVDVFGSATHSVHVYSWANQGASATVDYGYSGSGTGNVTKIVVEVLAVPDVPVAIPQVIPPWVMPFRHPSFTPLQLQGDASPQVAVALTETVTAADSLTVSFQEQNFVWPGFAPMFLQPNSASLQLKGAQATVYEPALPETATATDMLTVAASVTLSGDTAAGTDAATVAVALALTETATGTDALIVSAAIVMADTATAVDQESPNLAAVPFTETGTVAEAILPAVAVPLTETGVVVEANTQTVAAPLADTSTAADLLSLSIVGDPVLVDTATALDVLAVSTVTFTITDTATGTDVMSVNVPITLPEPLTATDTLVIAATLTLAGDTATGSDALTVAASVALTGETGAASDVLTVASVTVPVAGDTATATDTLSVTAAVPLADAAAATDAVTSLTAAVPLSDQVFTEDDIPVLPATTIVLTDTATASDNMGFDVTVTLSDVATVLDHLLALRRGIQGNVYPREPKNIPGSAG